MFKSLRGRLITVAIVVVTAGWQLYAHKRRNRPVAQARPRPPGGHAPGARGRRPRRHHDRRGQVGHDRPGGPDHPDPDRRVRRRGAADPEGRWRAPDRRARGIDDEEQAKGHRAAQRVPRVQEGPADRGLRRRSEARVDRAIVASLGVDSITALGTRRVRQEETSDLENLLFGSRTPPRRRQRPPQAMADSARRRRRRFDRGGGGERAPALLLAPPGRAISRVPTSWPPRTGRSPRCSWPWTRCSVPFLATRSSCGAPSWWVRRHADLLPPLRAGGRLLPHR